MEQVEMVEYLRERLEGGDVGGKGGGVAGLVESPSLLLHPSLLALLCEGLPTVTVLSTRSQGLGLALVVVLFLIGGQQELEIAVVR